MIGKAPADVADHITQVRRYAALSGPFRPPAALQIVEGLDERDTNSVIAISASLAKACDTRADPDGDTWLMKNSERRWEIGSIPAAGLAEAVAWRRSLPTDQETNDLLDALLGQGLFAEEQVSAAIREPGRQKDLERIALAVERAAPVAPAHHLLDAVKSALLRSEAVERDSILLQHGFQGRESEQVEIAKWIAKPADYPPVEALLITGLPGIGKSTLLEQVMRTARDTGPDWLVVRLDFDRTGLDVQNWVGLTIEAARQLAAGLEEQASEVQRARLVAASGEYEGGLSSASASSASSSSSSSDSERLPMPLVLVLSSAVRQSGRPVLVVLDTLEVLRGRGETHPDRLFEWLDALLSYGVGPMSVLAAGRGDALDGAPERIGHHLALGGLSADQAYRLLADLNVPDQSFAAIYEIAAGNPLVLRLAAQLVMASGPEALAKTSKGKSVTAAHLYRFLLSRIDDPTLLRLAHPGLVVRRINAEVIAEVLGPVLGLGRISPSRAERLFEELATHHWLVYPDPEAPGFVRHRPDMRAVLLPLQYLDDPVKSAAIDRAAAAWFAKRSESWCAVESAYHRLQLMRRDTRPPPIDASLLHVLDEASISELPEIAQDVVRRARGQRSTKFRGLDFSLGGSLDPGAARELQSLIDRGDWAEGTYVYEQTFAVSLFDPRSLDADVARTFLWRSGRWREAKRLLQERDALDASDDDLPDLEAQLALARLEMRAEFGSGAWLRDLRRDAPDSRHALEVAFRTSGTGLSQGALGFVLRMFRGVHAPMLPRGQDVVDAVFSIWGDVSTGRDVSEINVLSAASRQLGRVIFPPEHVSSDSSVGKARLLSILSPYTHVASTLGRTSRHGRTADVGHLNPLMNSARATVERLTGLPPAHARQWALSATSSTADPYEFMTAIGLFAEWLGVLAHENRDGDLELIARSAERWRRTVAGRWSYGRPFGEARETWTRPIDVTMADRIAVLAASKDPASESLDQLAAWMGADDGGVVLRGLERRLPNTLRRAGQLARQGPEAVAEVLLGRFVPSAFVPPLAILLGAGRRSSS